ncbi:hypothetical protein [Tersicoccus sp. Bi-70]|uniref:hypothetical protein n=1 Tax=Tersicoccus sp. Bi-70 TaxID=1897634 RepID=UPI00130119DF|nr:hypothetical protein [Tersicoccus sp. Bi-70]
MNDFLAAVAVLLPSLGVGVLFFIAMRALLNADRTERRAFAEAEEKYRKSHSTDA